MDFPQSIDGLTGFCLWYKHFEQAKFQWPRKHADGAIGWGEREFISLLDVFGLVSRLAEFRQLQVVHQQLIDGAPAHRGKRCLFGINFFPPWCRGFSPVTLLRLGLIWADFRSAPERDGLNKNPTGDFIMRRLLIMLPLPLIWLVTAAIAEPINFQGQLQDGSGPYTGVADMSFQLYDSLSGGSTVGPLVSKTDVPVIDGVFQVELDFGENAFNQGSVWLEVEVEGSILSPRQAVSPVPLALHALSAPDDGEGGSKWESSGNDIYFSTGNVGIGVTQPGWELHVVGDTLLGGDAIVNRNLSIGALTPQQTNYLLFRDADPNSGPRFGYIGPGQIFRLQGGSNFWIDMNARVDGELTVFGSASLGSSSNQASGGNSFVAGGSQSDPNTAAGGRSFIGGGAGGLADGLDSFIGGGANNSASGGFAATMGGGFNTASGSGAVVAGGDANTAQGRGSGIVGGLLNIAEADYTFVGGGANNSVTGLRSGISGGDGNSIETGYSFIGGGEDNTISSSRGFIGGGRQNSVNGIFSFVGGGANNNAGMSWSFVGGGENNSATGQRSFVGGGVGNTASGERSFVGGGTNNVASGTGGFVAGGSSNRAQGTSSVALGRRAKALHEGAFVWAGRSDQSDFESTAAHQFLIRAGGGVGINTNSPSGVLHVTGGNAIIGGWEQDERLGVGTTNPWNTLHVVANEGQGPFRFAQGTSDNIVLRGHENRGVSVGGAYSTANVPASGLRVFGQVRLGGLASATSINVCRTSDGTLANCTSSARYKRNIQPLDLDADRLAELSPARYRWHDRDEADIGLIAEDVAEVFPELVYHDEEGQIEGIVHSRLMAVLIAAYQGLRQETEAALETLAEENRALRADASGLAARLNALEAENAELHRLAERNAELENLIARMEVLLSDRVQVFGVQR